MAALYHKIRNNKSIFIMMQSRFSLSVRLIYFFILMNFGTVSLKAQLISTPGGCNWGIKNVGSCAIPAGTSYSCICVGFNGAGSLPSFSGSLVNISPGDSFNFLSDNVTPPTYATYAITVNGQNLGTYQLSAQSVSVPFAMPSCPATNNDKGDNGGCNSSGCSSCSSGMPTWKVSQPYISLWLWDEPLGYQPSVGPRISFKLAFKQREITNGFNTNLFSVGKKWNCSLVSYVTRDSDGNNLVFFPEGGQRTFYSTNEYFTNTRLTGNTNTGFTVFHPDGSQNIYGFIVTNNSGIFQKAFLTQIKNPQGQQTILTYYDYDPVNPVIRLQYVIDGDGRTNSIYYVANNLYSTNLISQVVDSFGHTNSLAYDNSGHLTNSIDVAGIPSSFTYDANDWINSMTTPYGTTSFAITDTSGANVAPNGRSVLVTQPDGGRQLYLYTNNAPGVVSSYVIGQIPNTSPFINTLDTNDLNLRNSFYWGPRQYAALSTTNIFSFNANDFQKAKMQHWLKTTASAAGETLSMERDPSPDNGGTIEGQKTWYDYIGKYDFETESTGFEQDSQIVPLLVARVLPDGTTSFTRTARNSFGAVTNEISTYSVNGSVLLRTNIYVYDADDIDLLTMTNALGVLVSSNAYNANHEVVARFNALGEKTDYTYDGSQRLIRTITPNGLVVTNIYGADGFLAQQIIIGFATNSYTYTNDLVFTHTDPRGLITTNTWDNLNRLTSMRFPDSTFITNIYSKLDLVQTIDRMGFTNSFGYDSMRRKIAETNALGQVTLYDYCTCGSLDSMHDAAGNTTSFSYDNQGNLTNTAYADGYSASRVYDLLRRVVKTSDSGGNSVTNYFNNQGLIYAVSNAFGQVQGTLYDILDRATNNVDANGVSIGTTYDDLNRPLTRSYPDGGVEHWVYTLNISGATSYTNQINNITLYGYDAMSRKTNEISVGVTTNSFAYAGAGDLLTLTDGKNQVTTWIYDTFGRVTNKLDAANNLLFFYKYDTDNRLTNRTSLAKGSTTYKYDSVGNLTNIVYPVSPAISLAYDVLNRLTNMMDAVGTTRYSYDQVGQLLSEDGPWANDTLSYAYANRLRTGLSLLAPNASAWSQTYVYDVMRRMTNTTSPAGAFGYQYVGSGPSTLVSRLALPNGAYITNAYDNVARELSTILKNSGNAVLDSESYLYNQGNQRTAETNTAGDYRNYTYDNIGELKTAIGKESGGVTNRWQEQFGYIYDAAGNLNYRTNNALVQTFNVNSLNELTTVTNTGRLTVAGTTTSPATNVTVNTSNAVIYADVTFASTNQPWVNGNNTFKAIAKDSYGRIDTNTITVNLLATNIFAYDLNGNMITNGNQVLDYDDENELIRVTVANSFKKEYVYDGMRRLRIRKEYGWIGSAWTQTNEIHYVWDGSVILQLRDANNLPTLTFTRGRDLSGSLQDASGIGGLLAMTENSTGTYSYYHADGNGNITCLISANQLVVGKYLYDPFGNPLSESGTKAFVNPFWFCSQFYDGNAGFLHYKYRVYASELQRWLNRDPIQEQGGVNLYEFVDNEPIRTVDFFGFGTWQINEKTIDLNGPGIGIDAQAMANSEGFEVKYIPSPGECEDGKIILYQIISSTGINGRTAHVDANGVPTGTCRLPPPMRPLGSTPCSYLDSPTTEGVWTFRLTAVAVCRNDCKDKVLSTYYFEFSNKNRTIGNRDPDYKHHFENGMKDWNNLTR